MTIRVGVNGFGRIGRNFWRAVQAAGGSDVEIVAVNDLTDKATLAHLLKYDTVLGTLPGEVEVGEDSITVGGTTMKALAQRDPAQLPWGDLGVDIVVESTGFFTKAEDAKKHLDAGAKKVIISAPAKGEDLTVVMGVNDDKYDPANHHILSNASCTTNCVAALVSVLLREGFGLAEGLMTSVHAYTASQRIVDGPSKKDWRGGRAAAINIIPASTGAAKAVGLVLPEVKGKLTGMSFRVPTPTVSVVDLTFRTEKETSLHEIKAAFRRASETYLSGLLGYTEDEVASTDFIHDGRSAIFDAGASIELNRNFFKLVGWYDNEWGFSNRMVELARKVAVAL